MPGAAVGIDAASTASPARADIGVSPQSRTGPDGGAAEVRAASTDQHGLTLPRPAARRRWPQDDRGEALPAAILFTGVLFTVLIGIHVVIVAMARTAVQSAADAAVAAAQAAGPGRGECDGDANTIETARECEGILGARLAMAASRSSIIETRPPVMSVEAERGIVRALVFGGAISPVFAGLELTAQACAPLDDVAPSELTGDDIWQC